MALTVFLPPWVISHYQKTGICAPRGPCPPAYNYYSKVHGVTRSVDLIFAPFVGIMIDYTPTYVPFLFSTMTGIAGYALMTTLREPTDKLIYLSAVLIGMAEIGIVISSLSLVTGEYVSKTVRGQLGCYCNERRACGVFGLSVAG